MFSYFGLGIQMYSVFRKLRISKVLSQNLLYAKNEEGNLEELISRLPKQIYSELEVIIICGPSKDGTLSKRSITRN